MYQHSASDGPKCYRLSADKNEMKLLGRVAAGNIVDLIDSLNEDAPGLTNMSIADFAPHKKTPVASLPPTSDSAVIYALRNSLKQSLLFEAAYLQRPNLDES